jgi:hypothetical protein
MDVNAHLNSTFPNAEQSQHLVDIPSNSIQSDGAPTCVHIREEDSHCEQCRQHIRSMSRSMLQQPSQLALSAPLGRESTDPYSAGANNLRQRRRASHFPSASDMSMGPLFPSSPRDNTSSVPAHPWRESKRRDSPASRSLTSVLHSSRNASAHSRVHQSLVAA